MKINLKDFFRGRVICHCLILSLLVSNTVFLLLFLRYYTPPLPEVFLKNGKENIPVYTKEASFKDGGKLFLAYNENAVFLELNTPGGSVSFESKKDSFYFFSTFFDSMWQFSNRGYNSYCSSINNVQFLDLNKDGINDIKITETGIGTFKQGSAIGTTLQTSLSSSIVTAPQMATLGLAIMPTTNILGKTVYGPEVDGDAPSYGKIKLAIPALDANWGEGAEPYIVITTAAKILVVPKKENDYEVLQVLV
jgi:hypothetical protein